VAVEQVVLQHPDGSSEVYELDANRDSNIPPEKLPLVGTKIGEHPAPSVSVPGLIFFEKNWSKEQFIEQISNNVDSLYCTISAFLILETNPFIFPEMSFYLSCPRWQT
jgi:hypothetical protein